MEITFGRNHLAVEQNSYATNFLHGYIVYDLNSWPNNPLRIFTLRHYLFGATIIAKNSDKEKVVSK